jgi:hypothetical protein
VGFLRSRWTGNFKPVEVIVVSKRIITEAFLGQVEKLT